MKAKKLVPQLLAYTLCISMLASCSSSSESTTTAGNSSGSDSTSASSDSSASTAATTADSGEIREYTAFYAVPGSEIDDDNEVQQAIAELTGAKVTETWLTGQTASEAVGTLIAGGEYPDLIDGSDGTAQLYEAGALIPLDEYLDDYPNLKNFWSEEEWDKVRQDDGHIYWIPQFGNPYVQDMSTTPAEAFWVQTRVLKWADYPEITTLDEYFDLLESYYAANPTMEDGTSIIPFTILCDDWRYFCLENPPQFLAGYPNDGSVIVDTETETIVDYNTIPEAVTYFEKLNEEYAKGIVDAESFTSTYDEYIAKLSTGRVLGMVDQWWQFSDARDSIKSQGLSEEGCNFVPLSLVIDESVTPNYNTEAAINVSNGVGISVSCEDPEGVLQFLNDLLEPEVRILRGWGIEGEDYEVDEDGVFSRTEEKWANASDATYQASHLCSYSYLPNYTGLLADEVNAADPSEQPSEFYESLPSDVQETFTAYGAETYIDMADPADEAPGPWFPMYSYSNTMTTSTEGGTAWTKMGEIKHEYLPKVIMAEDFDTAWEEYMAAYNEADPQAFLDEMQEELDRRIAEAAQYEN